VCPGQKLDVPVRSMRADPLAVADESGCPLHPTTAGTPYSRAITAPWVITPTSVTSPEIARNRGANWGPCRPVARLVVTLGVLTDRNHSGTGAMARLRACSTTGHSGKAHGFRPTKALKSVHFKDFCEKLFPGKTEVPAIPAQVDVRRSLVCYRHKYIYQVIFQPR
jgi:hypothetical protein